MTGVRKAGRLGGGEVSKSSLGAPVRPDHTTTVRCAQLRTRRTTRCDASGPDGGIPGSSPRHELPGWGCAQLAVSDRQAPCSNAVKLREIAQKFRQARPKVAWGPITLAAGGPWALLPARGRDRAPPCRSPRVGGVLQRSQRARPGRRVADPRPRGTLVAARTRALVLEIARGWRGVTPTDRRIRPSQDSGRPRAGCREALLGAHSAPTSAR
jgi:hypothetical protein